ncbi:hypothetical protein K7432_013122 [Basidiobolus ranarum]|uniref:Isochorismatase-like domain-containing protein n=1 Tax=Basidiobolus ranarum TaxID=34480 RepID=A0ABR2WJT5_9FUNG
MIGHQASLFSLVDDWQSSEFKANVLRLAEASALLDIPVMLTSGIEEVPNGPLVPQGVSSRIPSIFLAREKSILGIVVRTFKVTCRKQIVMASIVIDVCITFPALSAVQEGYEMLTVFDASGKFNQGVRDFSLAQMVQAGVQSMNLFSTVCELAGKTF